VILAWWFGSQCSSQVFKSSRYNPSKTWTLREQDKSRITAAEMKLMRKTAKYTWQDHKINQEIMNELKTNPVLEKINNYKEKWIQHVHRMERSILPCAILNYQSSGKRNHGRPLK
jgi:hypothetical protein